MDDLIEWLRQQLADDERAALAATPGPWSARFQDTGAVVDPEVAFDREEGGVGWEDAIHIARHDPRQVLARVEAERAVLDLWELARMSPHSEAYGVLTEAVRALVSGCRHRPGWRAEWE